VPVRRRLSLSPAFSCVSCADLDDLARPLWMAHDVAMHVEPLPDDCLHVPAASSAFAGGMSAPGAARAPKARSRPTQAVTTSIHPRRRWIALAMRGVGPARWHIFRFPGSMNSSLFAVEVAMARPPSSLR